MPKIQKLSDEIISRVAAGEVIEHPASVVKELVENSIDAGATDISIEIEDIGLSKIRVIDNGVGIEKEELPNSVQRYSTSKIYNLDDLESIKTLGFRGEALFSIAAVSNLEIKSRVKNSIAGYLYSALVNPSSLDFVDSSIKPVGMPEGTVVTVENLFYNLPGRKKFYTDKSYVTKKIIQVVTEAALANTSIAFKLSINGRINLQVPKQQDLTKRIGYLLGDDVSENFLPLNHTSEYFEMEGFLSKPQGALSTADFQYIFVNNRPVQSREISKLVKVAFGSLLESKSHPVFIISLSVPHDLLDINVHPRKTEILFINSDLVLRNVSDGVRKCLGVADLGFKYNIGTTQDAFYYGDNYDIGKNPTPEIQEDTLANNKRGNPYLAQTLKDKTNVWNIKTGKDIKDQEILQIHNLYLILENPSGMLVLDQHAVHERILFEEFLDQFQKEKELSKLVDINTYIDLPVTYIPVLESNIVTLTKLGIYIEKFRSNTFKINKVPEVFLKHDIKRLLIDVLKDLEEAGRVKESDQDSIKTISYLACRTAIKGGDYLTQEERRNLVDKLAKTKSNYTCPHGRPVKIEISKRELAKMFKRVK